MESFLVDGGLPALFLLSFAAATILPLGSELFLVLLLFNGHNPTTTVFVATIGNFLGALTTYYLGIYGSEFIHRKILRINEKDLMRVQSLYEKYGKWSLLLSWLPIIGDPLCLVAGFFKMHPATFSLLVFSGKACRYTFLAYLVIQSQTML